MLSRKNEPAVGVAPGFVTSAPVVSWLPPAEVLAHCFSFLDQASLLCCGEVSREWHLQAVDSSLWKALVCRDFTAEEVASCLCSTAASASSGLYWKEVYFRCHACKVNVGFIVLGIAGDGVPSRLYGELTPRGALRQHVHVLPGDPPRALRELPSLGTKRTGTQRGGKSALRFARLRLERIMSFAARICAEASALWFPKKKKQTKTKTETEAGQEEEEEEEERDLVHCRSKTQQKVKGIVWALTAPIRKMLEEVDLVESRMSPHLHACLLQLVTVSYGGSKGLKEAVRMYQSSVDQQSLPPKISAGFGLAAEEKAVHGFFQLLNNEPQRCCYELSDLLLALKQDKAESLLISRRLDLLRWTLLPSAEAEKEGALKQSLFFGREIMEVPSDSHGEDGFDEEHGHCKDISASPFYYHPWTGLPLQHNTEASSTELGLSRWVNAIQDCCTSLKSITFIGQEEEIMAKANDSSPSSSSELCNQFLATFGIAAIVANREPARNSSTFSQHNWRAVTSVDIPPENAIAQVDGSLLDLNAFRETYDVPCQPVLLDSLVKDWAAITEWTWESLMNKYSRVPFKVYEPFSALSGGKVFATQRLAEFSSFLRSDTSSKEYIPIVLDNKFGDKCPEMRTQFSIPLLFAQYCTSKALTPDPILYISPAGAATPLHLEPDDTSGCNVLIQGKKLWVFFPNTTSSSLPGWNDGADAHMSGEYWFATIYHSLTEGKFDPLPWLQCVQQPGQVVFFPNSCVHCVLSLEACVALSINFL